MGSGSDIATLNSQADLTQLTALDGEGPLPYNGTPSPIDDRSEGTNALFLNNTLTGSTTGAGVGAAGNALIANWDQVNIGANAAAPSRLNNCGTMCAEYRQLTQAGNRPHPIWGRMSFGTLKEQGENRLGYKSASGDASQNGYGLGASVEVGRPWQLGSSNWQIEPQAQLSYQYVHLSDFDDNVRSVDGQSGGTLRGRLGTRLAWNADNGKQRTSTFYVAVNVLHDLAGNKSKADIGNDRITEHYARTWGEVSVGGQVALSKSTYLFGDVRYSW